MSVSLLTLQNVCLSFDERRVLDRINLSLFPGQITTLIGPNGSGKSTLIKVILGLTKADSGEIERRAKLRIGYVPQKVNVDESLPLTVKGFLKLSRHGSQQDLPQAIELLGIESLMTRQVSKLSGGEMQRVLLARAILARPQLLVLDEPVQGVDINGQIELYQLITQIAQSLNAAVFMVSHDLHLVMASTDHVICLNHHICCEGQPESVAQHPEFAKLFAGEEQQQLAVYTHHHHCDDHDHEHLNQHQVVTEEDNTEHS
ncbi:zinc ABC transporter ATP-binding protein ZnuC [Alginatibacterium sediminis]|uniref:Zinc ABC transporter ATP-binding protein ZnuC n=1 Tax=Alginatibacterium sediminis TaxID=2164068 RepID=A0A420EN27_9ALTE|nr:zinc ABC transporter ATP-binding protein ZnuC [Alginatibacterium sediminis]RKF22078.1 zinc ABC transporter ATP-binding protein ZnuC [Alginatibacterium sediminis]